MPIKQEVDGKEVELFTAEEVQNGYVNKTELEKANAEVERLKKVSAEKTENFKKLNEMSEEERSKLSAQQIEDRKRIEAAESKAAKLEEQINTDAQARIQHDKDSSLFKFHGGNPELKKALEENYELINIAGTDTASIQKRAEMAASMERGKNNKFNPLMANMIGDAPKLKQKTEQEEFEKSEKYKEALRRMGEDPDKKPADNK